MNNSTLFDRGLVRARRGRAAAGDAPHFLIERAAGDIAERVAAVNRQFSRMLEVSAVPGAIAAPLIASGKVQDGVIGLVGGLAGTAQIRESWPAAMIEEEALPLAPASFDLVASALTLQAVNDLPGTLVQINRALVPDGLFVAALFGGDTLSELRQAFAAAEAELSGGLSPRVMPFTDIREAGQLLQRAGFTLPVADSDRITVRYATPVELMADLRAMGETNALLERARRPLRRAVLGRMLEIYGERFADPDGRVRATFEILTMTGWRAHESQQRPLAPGSARMRLASALGTSERTAGERAKPQSDPKEP